MHECLELKGEECVDAVAIQTAIDALPSEGGGVIQLPELDLTLDRGLELRSGVELRGYGEKTILRKAASEVYPLTGYSNYGMLDVQLMDATGLEPGMTVSIKDNVRQGFYSTFARITWVDGDWLGLDHGLEADLAATENPVLTTAFPLVFGHGVRNAKVADLTLLGEKSSNPDAMDGCRGGAVYFLKSHDIDIEGIRERDFNGEGVSFQMCSDMRIRNCSFIGNTGNGMHPGAGSTNVLFERCEGMDNGRSGFFFCVRANHVTVRKCLFSRNAETGVSIGNRDCHNLIESCEITDNVLAGVMFRGDPKPVEARFCEIRGSNIARNALKSGIAQIEVLGHANNIIIEDNTIDGEEGTAGVATSAHADSVFANSNEFVSCEPDKSGSGFTEIKPRFESGQETTHPKHYRHLER
ncbi:MAG: right-handed parallel beta-helix repeat-containing protein [Victivallales bacterium]|nr:right-handed parallel beta-helix repeat-containing protein [Victivallales bacterium]